MDPKNFAPLLTTPSWKRAQLLRRCVALILCLLAAALGWRSHVERPPQILVAARDVPVGTPLTPDDLTLIPVQAEPLSDDTLHTPDHAIGKTTATALKRGDILTPRSVLGKELAAALAPSHSAAAALVPVKLADPATAALIYPGVEVSVVRADKDRTDIIARGARVVFATEKEKGKLSAGTVLLVLPPAEAQQVAAASLSSPLTVVIGGGNTHRPQPAERI